MKPFYSDTLARVYQSDVFEWCAWYQREIEAGRALYSLQAPCFCIGCSVARVTKCHQIIKLVCRNIVIIEPPIWFGMMNRQGLTKLYEALLLGHLTMLAGVIISPAGFTLLSLPVRTVAVSRRAVDILRMLFSYSVFVSTWPCAIFSSPLCAFKVRFALDKSNTASLANQLHRILGWARPNGCILTFWRAMLASSMIKAGAFDFKYFVTKFTGSIYKTLRMYSAFSRTMNFITKQGKNRLVTNFTVHRHGLQTQNPHGRFAPLPRQCETIRVFDKDVIMTKCLRIGLSRQIQYSMG